jgi:hypothetical protein
MFEIFKFIVGVCLLSDYTVLQKENFFYSLQKFHLNFVFNTAESESEARKFLSHTSFERNEVIIKFNITIEYLILFTLIYQNSLLMGQMCTNKHLHCADR